MRKYVIIFLCTWLLVGCSEPAKMTESESKEENRITNHQNAMATGSAIEDETPAEIVVDEMGNEQKLQLGDIDLTDVGVYFSEAFYVSDYSQVDGENYYYVRYMPDGYYAVYRNQGEIIGEFALEEDCEPRGFVKYGNRFYILTNALVEREYNWVSQEKVAYIDFEKKEIVDICDVTDDHMLDDGNLVFCNLYQNSLFYDSRSEWDEEYQRAGTSMKYDIQKGAFSKMGSFSTNMAKAKPYLTYVEGKIYYGVSEGKRVTLYSYELNSGVETEIFRYERKKEYEADEIYLVMDEDYIYCQDYLIPRAGGKMTRAFQKAKKFENGRIYFCQNQKFIFYISKDDKVHRISKATLEDVVISKRKAVGVDCTENQVYVKVHDKIWYNEEWQEEFAEDYMEGYTSGAFYTHHLYCMDEDGRNEKRLWEGGYEE